MKEFALISAGIALTYKTLALYQCLLPLPVHLQLIRQVLENMLRLRHDPYVLI
jgi:hypothetical protein